MKAFYDSEPSAFHDIGDGSVLYRYDITQSERKDPEGEIVRQWECSEVKVWKPLSANRIFKAVLGDVYDESQELKAINEYNEALLGIRTDNKDLATLKYSEFLAERARLKSIVDRDCAANNIK